MHAAEYPEPRLQGRVVGGGLLHHGGPGRLGGGEREERARQQQAQRAAEAAAGCILWSRDHGDSPVLLLPLSVQAQKAGESSTSYPAESRSLTCSQAFARVRSWASFARETPRAAAASS